MRLTLLASGAVLALSACAGDGQASVSPSTVSASSATISASPEAAASAGAVATAPKPPATSTSVAALPSTHVHAVSREPSTGEVLVATHEGLYVYGKDQPRRVGSNIDLMGFTVAGPRHYYASGHPGPGVDLPQPAGLLESRDGGQTWAVLSRGGSSDFHALAASPRRVVAFDGILRTTTDGRTWTTGELTSAPRALAVSPDGRRALATTADGLMSSDDGGLRWEAVVGAPLLLLVDWADEHAVAGLTPQGEVHTSADAGRTWRATGIAASEVQAFDATGSPDGIQLTVATKAQLVTHTAPRT